MSIFLYTFLCSSLHSISFWNNGCLLLFAISCQWRRNLPVNSHRMRPFDDKRNFQHIKEILLFYAHFHQQVTLTNHRLKTRRSLLLFVAMASLLPLVFQQTLTPFTSMTAATCCGLFLSSLFPQNSIS